MILQEHPVLDELALVLLVQEPGATARRVWELLTERGYDFTLRGVYKELSKLIDQGIVFKRGETYNVRLAWIMNLLAFGDRAYERYTSSEYLKEAIGGEDEKRVERFTDLRKLDRLWTQLILTLHQLHPEKIACFWCPYQWFSLAHHFTAKQFYQASELAGYKRCHIIGVDTFLSRRALKDLPKGGSYSFAKSPFHAERSTYYTVVGNRIITVKIDKQTTERLHELFHSIRSESEIRPSTVEAVLGAKVKATLTIEVNEAKAGRLRKKFSDFFGIVIA